MKVQKYKKSGYAGILSGKGRKKYFAPKRERYRLNKYLCVLFVDS